MLNANFKLLKMDNPEDFKNFDDFEAELKKRVKGYYDMYNDRGDKDGWVIDEDELN